MKKFISWLLIKFRIHLIPRKQKATIYRNILWELRNYQGAYICLILNKYNKGNFESSHSLMFLYYPEIYVQKPTLRSQQEGWFRRWDRESRYNLVQNALNMLNYE